MGRRQRQRAHPSSPLKLAPVTYPDPETGSSLTLRCSLTAATRSRYAQVARGAEDLSPAATRDDAWQRSVEFLFEHLAVSWTISAAPPITSQRALLSRLRVASPAERAWLRDRLREHCTEHFPELAAP
jgi:hypothetical protein